MRIVLLLGIFVGSASEASAQLELEKFQGTWQAVKLTAGGVDAPAANLAKMTITITGDKATRKDDPSDVAKVTLNAQRKPPEIDLTDANKKVSRGIYRFIDKDTLEMCLTVTEDLPRPKDFVAPKGTNVIIMLLKRMKE